MSKQENVTNLTEGAGNLLVLVLAGIVQCVKMITFKRCKIFVENTHHHKINVALHVEDKHLLKGWYVIEANTKNRIFKTKRITNRVGIHAKCPICGKVWGNQGSISIPNDGQDFHIDKNSESEYSKDNNKTVGFDYSKNISKEKEYTFKIV